jgi:nondiscriminating glutamyl-tRNA synthetase
MLYHAFEKNVPIFWHLPIICNAQGKKLSKRDFGFSLQDLRKTGFLPQAIDNYLATIGGGTFTEEIMSLEDLVKAMNFSNIHSTGHVRYDVEKLRWLNHKWINRISNNELVALCKPVLLAAYEEAHTLTEQEIEQLITFIKTDIQTLDDVPKLVAFFFNKPTLTRQAVADVIGNENISPVQRLIKNNINLVANSAEFVHSIKKEAKADNIAIAHLFKLLRLALIGSPNGPAINEIIDILGTQEALQRIERACTL